jgi:hypothetical protein
MRGESLWFRQSTIHSVWSVGGGIWIGRLVMAGLRVIAAGVATGLPAGVARRFRS